MKKKTLAILLMLSLVTGLFAGCGNSEAEQSAEPSETITESNAEAASDAEEFDAKAVTEGVKLTILTPEFERIEDYETNQMVLAAEEALGVDLEFMTFPEADYETKVNLLINSGEELPDIIFNPSNVDSLYSEGIVLPLTEYFNDPNYSPNITKYCETHDVDLVKIMANAEGEVLGIPSYSRPGEPWEKMHIYKPWLDALGEDIPETTEEFYELCKKVAETDLNGNGKKDEIALLGISSDPDYKMWTDGWFGYLMSPYVYAYRKDYLYVEDGKLNFAFEQESWKDGMKYIKKYFEDGLIPTEALVYTSEDQVDVITYAEPQVQFSFVNNRFRGTDQERGDGYYVIGALEGPSGLKQSSYASNSFGYKSVITTDCENPGAAFMLLDFWGSEHFSIVSRFGEEGVDWDYWENAKVEDKSLYELNNAVLAEKIGADEILFVTYDDSSYWTGTEPQNSGLRQLGIYLDWASVSSQRAKLKLTDEAKIAKEEYTVAVKNEIMYDERPTETIDSLPMTVDESDRVAELLMDISDYVEQMKAAWLAGELDIDGEWDSYLAELKKLGTEELLSIYQTAFDRTR